MAGPHEGRPPHPKYGPPLSGRPQEIEGVTFRPYRLGIARYTRVSDDFRIELQDPGATYRAVVDGVALPTKFRRKETAVRAALAAIKAKGGE